MADTGYCGLEIYLYMKIRDITYVNCTIHPVVFSNFDIDACCPNFCEAQGKGRVKGQLRKVTQRSFIDYRWWMVDILSLMLYTKFG